MHSSSARSRRRAGKGSFLLLYDLLLVSRVLVAHLNFNDATSHCHFQFVLCDSKKWCCLYLRRSLLLLTGTGCLARSACLTVIEGSFDILSRARSFRKFAVATSFRLSFAANQPPTSMWMELVYFKYRFRNLHLCVEDTLPQRSASRSRIYPSSLCGAMCLVH